ncbi:MAG: histidine phosphatase family protein [Balneola sp.]|nr:MAG: histidine phosphatase family protein [Balneola sp.]
MKQVYFIRHGETDNNKNRLLQGRKINASINEKGREQAKAIADALADVPIKKIVTSSLVRAIETAEPLMISKNLDSDQYEELDEMSFGDWDGRPFSEVISPIKAVQEAWIAGETNTQIPGGESPEEVFERAGKKVIHILNTAEEQYLAFIVHGRLIRILLSKFLGFGLQNMHLIKHSNGAINHLTWDGDKFEAVKLNSTEHLPEEEIA